MQRGNNSPIPGLKVVRSREHIPLERRGSLPVAENFTPREQANLVHCASHASLPTLSPIMELPAPPDGGWGWVIVFASFMSNFIIDGIAYSFGVLLLPLVDHFQSSRTSISWVGSLLSGVFMISGPLVGGLVNKFGCRPICMLGGVTACLGLFLSTFAKNVPTLMLSYGILGGFGLGLIYLPAVVSCGYYFESKRALATGISVCGSGVGCFTFAPLTNFLLGHFGWKGTNIIYAGFCLQCCVFGALMRPLELSISEKDPNSNPDQGKSLSLQLPDGTSNSCHRDSLCHENVIDLSDSGVGILQTSPSTGKIAVEIIPEEEFMEDEDRFDEEPGTLSVQKQRFLERENAKRARRRTISETPNNDSSRFLSPRYGQPLNIRRNVSTPGLSRNILGLSTENSSHPAENIMYGVNDGSRVSLKPARRNSVAIVRPMSRKDIFYGGSITSLVSLSNHKRPPSKAELNRYRHSVISMPRGSQRLSIPRGSIVASHVEVKRDAILDEDLLEDVDLNRSTAALFRVFNEMMDVRLFHNRQFLFICISNVFGFLALYVPFMYLPNMMVLRGMTSQDASVVVSVIGIANTIGRIIVGWCVDFPWANSLSITNVSLLLSGFSVMSFTLCYNYEAFILNAFVLGISISAYIALTSIVLVDLLGLDLLTSAFGLLVLFRGVSSVVGPPLAGVIFDLTKDYNASFILAGIFFIVASLFSFIAQRQQKQSSIKQ